eukprot:4874921-Prymnesium_polylepis.1
MLPLVRRRVHRLPPTPTPTPRVDAGAGSGRGGAAKGTPPRRNGLHHAAVTLAIAHMIGDMVRCGRGGGWRCGW